MKDFRKHRELMKLAEYAVQLNKYDVVWDILDEAFNSFMEVHAWLLTESVAEYSIYSKELFEIVQKYGNVMYSPFRNFEWANE